MTDEETVVSARTFITAIRAFLDACEAYGVYELDPVDPIRQLHRDALLGEDYVQAELNGALRRIQDARVAEARRNRMAPSLTHGEESEQS